MQVPSPANYVAGVSSVATKVEVIKALNNLKAAVDKPEVTDLWRIKSQNNRYQLQQVEPGTAYAYGTGFAVMGEYWLNSNEFVVALRNAARFTFWLRDWAPSRAAGVAQG
jgi:hypothetical protein